MISSLELVKPRTGLVSKLMMSTNLLTYSINALRVFPTGMLSTTDYLCHGSPAVIGCGELGVGVETSSIGGCVLC